MHLASPPPAAPTTARPSRSSRRSGSGKGPGRGSRDLERYLLTTPERAAKRLEFIDHPLWRTYVFVYFEGERLLSRWLERVPAAERPARFGRLLAEQLTPGAIVSEIAGPEPTG